MSRQGEANLQEVAELIERADNPVTICPFCSLSEDLHRDTGTQGVEDAADGEVGGVAEERVGGEREEQSAILDDLSAPHHQFLAEDVEGFLFVAERFLQDGMRTAEGVRQFAVFAIAIDAVVVAAFVEVARPFGVLFGSSGGLVDGFAFDNLILGHFLLCVAEPGIIVRVSFPIDVVRRLYRWYCDILFQIIYDFVPIQTSEGRNRGHGWPF